MGFEFISFFREFLRAVIYIQGRYKIWCNDIPSFTLYTSKWENFSPFPSKDLKFIFFLLNFLFHISKKYFVYFLNFSDIFSRKIKFKMTVSILWYYVKEKDFDSVESCSFFFLIFQNGPYSLDISNFSA